MSAKRKNEPLWTSINPPPAQYPWLCSDEKCDVCVIGGGITGAMAAYRFAEAGVDTVLVTAHPIGYGGTAAACPSVRYDAGESLYSLSKKLGTKAAVETFKRSAEALDSLEQLVSSLGTDVGFQRRDCMVYTDSEEEMECINQEYLLRSHHGFAVNFINRDTARSVFPFDIAGAILSKNLAAEFDPYRLTHALLAKAKEKGARIYENTNITEIKNDPAESILTTETRHKITAGSLVMSIGSEIGEFLKTASMGRTSFAVVSQPVNDFSCWPGKCVISTWSKPYITLSATPDGRVFASGLDTGVVDGQGRLFSRLPIPKIMEKRFDELQATAEYMFPSMIPGGMEYAFSGKYADTCDGLPIFGEGKGYFNCYFAVCPGSNSALYAEMAGRMLFSQYMEEPIKELSLFSADRFE